MNSPMSDFPFDIVGFDLDGTLLDTSGDLSAATNHALALAGRPPLSVAQIRPMVGFGAKHMLEQGLMMSGGVPDDGFKPLYKALLAFYEDNISVHTRPFAGAETLLDQLDALGICHRGRHAWQRQCKAIASADI
jgi:phosphoglycolate phosphatase